ncbi:uncharacterized protein [Drosophila takahashii]|uniref:uncharacterized protein n=1 Tax=Drosophila takahashii TaxID=29030 RepID=UPI0038991424
MADQKTNIDLNLARYLFNQQTTPHSTTNRTPSELLMNPHLKTYFDKLQPQEVRFGKVNSSTNSKHFIPGDSVWVRNYATGPKWINGQIGVQTGPMSYTMRLEDNRVIRRHQDQFRSRLPQSNQPTEDEDNPEPTDPEEPPLTDSQTKKDSCEQKLYEDCEDLQSESPPVRRSHRHRKPTEFYSS